MKREVRQIGGDSFVMPERRDQKVREIHRRLTQQERRARRAACWIAYWILAGVVSFALGCALTLWAASEALGADCCSDNKGTKATRPDKCSDNRGTSLFVPTPIDVVKRIEYRGVVV
jgi:hypothetical protein